MKKSYIFNKNNKEGDSPQSHFDMLFDSNQLRLMHNPAHQ